MLSVDAFLKAQMLLRAGLRTDPLGQSASADHVPGYAYLPPHRWTTLYHGCARSSASGRSHMRVLPLGTLCPTTSAPWMIMSSSEIAEITLFQ